MKIRIPKLLVITFEKDKPAKIKEPIGFKVRRKMDCSQEAHYNDGGRK